MANVTLTLSDEAMALAERQARARGFADSGGYLKDLLVNALRREERTEQAPPEPDYGGPAHLAIGSRDELEEKLREALHSGPATEMTQADWDDMRRRLRERHARTNGQ